MMGPTPGDRLVDGRFYGEAGGQMSKAQQAAEERPEIAESGGYIRLTYKSGRYTTIDPAEVAALREYLLPEAPDPAVIEAMAAAIYNVRYADHPPFNYDRAMNTCRTLARAAYAALRGAMQ